MLRSLDLSDDSSFQATAVTSSTHNITAIVTRATVQDLPTALVSNVIKYLSLADLRNFCLTCKWAEHETFFDFARRGYTLPRSSRGGAKIQALLRIIERSESLAKAIKLVHLLWPEAEEERYWWFNGSVSKYDREEEPVPGVADILLRLPGLTSL